MLNFIVLQLFCLLLLFTTTTSAQAYKATEHFLLDCGSSNTTTISDQKWDRDERSEFVPSNITRTSFASTPVYLDTSVPQIPYSTARVFNTSTLTYTFLVSKGPKFLRLYFYPATYSGLIANQSFFSISSNGYSLLTNFSPFLTASFLGPVINNNTAHENVYRLNMGGGQIPGNDDTEDADLFYWTQGKDKQTPQGSARTTSAVDLEEFCEKHYEKLLPIMADKYEHERRKKEKLEEVKARLDFGDIRKRTAKEQESAYSESRTRSPRRYRRSHSPRQSPSVFTRLKRGRSRSPRHDHKNKAKRESTIFERLGSRGRSMSAYFDSRQENSRYTEEHSESEDSGGGHWKSKSRKQKPSVEDDDLSKPWVCAKTDPFTSRIRHFNFPKTRMPSHIKTYDGSGDPEDHLKIFQAAAKTERWVMPTWCHMFNSTLTGNARVWFDDLPLESIDGYDDLREAFLKNYLQQKKCIRDPIVLHNIKQRDVESKEDFIQRYNSESGDVKGAPECMRIFGFVHGITNPELIKRFYEKIPKTVDEMMQVATSFLQGQEAALNQEKKKTLPIWKHQEGSHREVGHNTDECNHLRKQIEDMLKAGKLSYLIKELKQNSGKDL
ncbi:reverse transcriptase domain-containing protein [Tanacetum coccineum]